MFTVLICLCLYFLPSIKAEYQAAMEEVPEVVVQETVIEIVTSEEVLNKEQLNIELPEGVEGKDITITNDMFTQTIWVRFAEGVDDYSEHYKVKGSSNNIANLTYYKDGEAGVLEITLDKVCDLSYSYKEGYLCLSIVDPHELYDKIIVVDAGHGDRHPGAVKKGINEKDINLSMIKQIKSVFDAAGDKNIKVYFTRLDDTNPSLMDRVELANNLKADMFISIHNNASETGRFTDENGTLVLYSPGDEGTLTSWHLAEICLENIHKATNNNKDGFKDGDYVYIVRKSEVPVVLIEVGYMTNVEELNRLIDPEYQRKVAEGVYNAVKQAIEEGY